MISVQYQTYQIDRQVDDAYRSALNAEIRIDMAWYASRSQGMTADNAWYMPKCLIYAWYCSDIRLIYIRRNKYQKSLLWYFFERVIRPVPRRRLATRVSVNICDRISGAYISTISHIYHRYQKYISRLWYIAWYLWYLYRKPMRYVQETERHPPEHRLSTAS